MDALRNAVGLEFDIGLQCGRSPSGMEVEVSMATVLLLTNDMHLSAEILPALELLPYRVHVVLAEATALVGAPSCDVILLDARRDLVIARALCRLIETTGKESPLLVVASEGGLPRRGKPRVPRHP